jgi:ParB family chromosome partitioning protein
MADTSTAYEKGKLYELELTRLQTDPSQPRKYMDPQAMEEMTVSVAKHGILEPILFRVAEGILYVVAGERRVEAAKKAGLTTIPAIFVEGNHAEIALVENLLRQDLTPVEEAEALDRLLQEQQYTHEQLAAMIGKARNTLTEILSLNRLPLEIRDECRGNTATARKTLIEIARKKQDRSMITAWNQYKDKLAKAAEGRKKRANVPESAVDIFKWVSKAVAKLEGLDTSAWTEDEKNTLNQTLQNLHESIQAILNPPAASRNLA